MYMESESRKVIDAALAARIKAECDHVERMQNERDARWDQGKGILLATWRVRRAMRTVGLALKKWGV